VGDVRQSGGCGFGCRLYEGAYDAGCNFFDNAEVYNKGKSELVMGAALEKLGWSATVTSSPARSCGARKKILRRRKWVSAASISSKPAIRLCERMKVDYLDLYFCHRPDPEVPMEEIVRGMTELILRGKVFYWGTSEWSGEEFKKPMMWPANLA